MCAGRGFRQEDPLCLYIFILVIEPLAMDIKTKKSTKGITIKNDLCQIGQLWIGSLSEVTFHPEV